MDVTEQVAGMWPGFSQFMADRVITAVVTLGSKKIKAYSPIEQIVTSAFAEDTTQ
jgi:hypothetical protein